MKSLVDYIKECGAEAQGIAPSIGSMEAASTYATPGNTSGMGNPKLPTEKDPGSEPLGRTSKMPQMRKKKRKDAN